MRNMNDEERSAQTGIPLVTQPGLSSSDRDDPAFMGRSEPVDLSADARKTAQRIRRRIALGQPTAIDPILLIESCVMVERLTIQVGLYRSMWLDAEFRARNL